MYRSHFCLVAVRTMNNHRDLDSSTKQILNDFERLQIESRFLGGV